MYKLGGSEVSTVADAVYGVAKDSKFRLLIIAEFASVILTAVLCICLFKFLEIVVLMLLLSCISLAFPVVLLLIYKNMMAKRYNPSIFKALRIILIISLVISIISSVLSFARNGIISTLVTLVIDVAAFVATLDLFNEISDSYKNDKMVYLDEKIITAFKALAVIQILSGLYSLVIALINGLFLLGLLVCVIALLGAVTYYAFSDISETYNGAAASFDNRKRKDPVPHCPRCNALMNPGDTECMNCHYVSK